MYLHPKHHKEKIDAAMHLLTQDTTTYEKFEKVRTLLKGIHPHVDNKLESCSTALKKLKSIHQGEIIELTLGVLPEDTPEQKKRKKALVLFLFSWKDLKKEVTRVKNIYQDVKTDGDITSAEKIASASKTVAVAKGPFGLITALAVVIVGAGTAFAFLKNSLVTVIIRNQNCDTINPIVKLPVSIPGIKLPTNTIPNGGSTEATVPALSVTVDGTNRSSITLTALNYKMEYSLKSPKMDLIFDGKSLLGKTSIVDLSQSKEHNLTIKCP